MSFHFDVSLLLCFQMTSRNSNKNQVNLYKYEVVIINNCFIFVPSHSNSFLFIGVMEGSKNKSLNEYLKLFVGRILWLLH